MTADSFIEWAERTLNYKLDISMLRSVFIVQLMSVDGQEDRDYLKMRYSEYLL